jgi:hypothetical protein
MGALLPVAALAGVEKDATSARARFEQENPRVGFMMTGSQIATIYGPAFEYGSTPEHTAERFVSKNAEMFGVEVNSLVPHGPSADIGHTLGAVFRPESGDYKFTIVYFSQYQDGIPVFRSDIRMLVRNEPGHPLVMVTSGLVDLNGFTAPAGASDFDFLAGQAAVQARYPELINFTAPELVIWAGYDGVAAAPALGVTFMAHDAEDFESTQQKRLFITDATTGQILFDEDQVLNIDVTGNVSGMATQGKGADICDPEEVEPMPYARVNIQGGNTVFADANGDFVIPNGGNSDVTVQSPVRGLYFRVENNGGSNTILSAVVSPPGPANFVHNQANNAEFVRAEVNGYVEANVVRDAIIGVNPSYPTISTDRDWPVNVNQSSTCNAFYNGSSINFYRAGGGCSNTANTTVVHHEYGHHLVASGRSGQGQYGEGMGDVLGVILTDDPILAYGFQNNCNAGIRNANNTMQYPCSGEIHFCGQLISGCVWSTRNELIVTEPDDYLNILMDLAVNSVLMHQNRSDIAPDITIAWLTLDDDDDNIGNGTPHYDEIAAGFGAHNMDAPPLELIGFVYPNGRPDRVTPNQPTDIRVDVVDVSGDAEEGSGQVHYRIGGGNFTTVDMVEGQPNQYTATLPGADCTEVIDYYFSAMEVGGRTITDPPGAPGDFFSALSASELVTVVAHDFEQSAGWTEDGDTNVGQWQRGIPPGCNRGDPDADFDGSGRCWATGNTCTSGQEDVDDGTVVLFSEIIDLTGSNDPSVRYARWYSNTFGGSPEADVLEVDVSDDGGSTWTSLEVVGPTRNSQNPEVDGDWFEKTFRIADFVDLTDSFQVRFSAGDLGQGSVIEAAIDAFEIFDIECGVEGEPVFPDAFEVTRGVLLVGGLDELLSSDDARLNVGARRPTEIAASSVEIELTGTSPTETPSALAFTVEAASSGDPANQIIELFNYDSTQWERLDVRAATNSDRTVTVNVTTNPGRFVEDGTGEMKARVGFLDLGVTFPSWDGRYDVTFWTIAQ